MCGITGFIGSGIAPDAQASILEMTNTLAARGPDDVGTWMDEHHGIALGHRRLAVIDLTTAGRQPMQSATGRYVLVFNGEIYNHLLLRQQLTATGQSPPAWRGHSDTETLLACLDAWGLERTLEAASGMFAFAVWDSNRQSLLLARDRLGEKPLYYGWQGDTFLFGSELKALRVRPAFGDEIDRGALTLYLRYNYVPSPYCIYAGIAKLPAGTYLEISKSNPSPQPVAYWQLSTVAELGAARPFPGDDQAATERLEILLGNSVRAQMVADVPLGALLSGGVDSSMICALMQANSTRRINTFTVGFSEAQYNEAEHAAAVARHLGTDHTELYLSARDALQIVPLIPHIWDEPFADSSQLPTYLVMKLARQQVSVALSGDGGDEVFCGYNRYVHVPRLVNSLGKMPRALQRAAGELLTLLPARTLNSLLGTWANSRGVALPGDKAHKLGQRMLAGKLQSPDDLFASILLEDADAESMLVGGYVPPHLLEARERWPELDDPVARMMSIDTLMYLPDDILVKIDRAAMAVSLETRAPFLDRAVLEFAWQLPLHMKLRGGRSKWIVRQLLNRYVPDTLIERPKMGFGVPLDDWLRGPLRDWAENLLAADRLEREGFFRAGKVRGLWERHTSGRANYGSRLWAILMFQAWLEASA